MHYHILCSCGYDIGAFVEIYRAILNDRYAKHVKNVSTLTLESQRKEIKIEMGDVFDALNFPVVECCRMRMFTVVTYIDAKYHTVQ